MIYRTKLFSTKNTFHLILKKKWFDMIFEGVKTEEYREVKPYWETRLKHLFPLEINGLNYYPIVDTITFSNGYGKNRRQFEIELKDIYFGRGVPEWGAEENQNYYVIKLGEVLQDNFSHEKSWNNV